MMTDSQPIKENEKNARQKADLVYRTGQTLENRFEKFEEIPKLLDILTDKALEKLDLPKKISMVLKLAIAIIKRYGPLTIDEKGNIIKKFQVMENITFTDKDKPPEHIKDASITMIFSRKATDEEFNLRNDILNCIDELQSLITPGLESHCYTFQELDEKALSALKKDADAKGMKYQINAESITYWGHQLTKDAPE